MRILHYPPKNSATGYAINERLFLRIGRFSYMNPSQVFQEREPADITIGNFCSIGEKCRFFSRQDHMPDWVTAYPAAGFLGAEAEAGRLDHLPSRIVIGNDVWVGYGATFLAGAVVGDGAIIGSNAVVAEEVPPYSIFVGNPGRVVKMRFPEPVAERLQRIAWWNWDEARIRQFAHLIWSDHVEGFIEEVEAELDAS